MLNRDKPYNDLPLLPPKNELENKEILKTAINANKAVAELKGVAKTIPNQAILVNSLPLQEAKSSSAIENVMTTNDILFEAFASKSYGYDTQTKEVLRYKEVLWEGYNRLRKKFSRKPNLSKGYIRLYGKYNKSFITICGLTLYPIYGCNYNKTMCFDQNINNYTKEGRKLIHDKIDNMYYFIRYLLMHSNENDSAELTDNKISLICGQRGKCYVTGKELEVDPITKA